MLDALLEDLLEASQDGAEALRPRFRVFHPREIAERIARRFGQAGGSRRQARLAWAAGELCGPFSVKFLAECAGSPEGEVRRLAASALGKAVRDLNRLSEGAADGLETALEALNRLSADEVKQVAEYARKALGELRR
jgi:HEAT repeat protein